MRDKDKNALVRETLNEQYPSNSKFKKDKEKEPTEKKVEKIVKGKVIHKKTGLARKAAETFLEDSLDNAKQSILHDTLIPAAKALICDIVGWGGFAEQLLFGTNRATGRSNSRSGRSHTPYGSFYREVDKPRTGVRDVSYRARTRHDFGDIILETRGEAEDVLSHLCDMIEDFGQATVADLYDLIGATSAYTDHKYGWTDLRGASVNRVSAGYLLNLPRTQILE